MHRFQVKRLRGWKLIFGIIGCGLLGSAFLRGAMAQTPPDECQMMGKACTFALSNGGIQKMTPLFKLQAEISQAKIPVGDAVFSTLIVNVNSGGVKKCTETFGPVRVRNGVLNLEIGRAIQCGSDSLDSTITKSNDLSFQICIGDTAAGNCLKPIQMSNVPYAVKANYASQAETAYRAELASRANYAQRLTTDGNMLEQKQIGTGYFEVQRPGVAGSGTGTANALNAFINGRREEVSGGFITWAPVNPENRFINFGAKDLSTTGQNLARLKELLVHADRSSLWGNLYVSELSTLDKLATFNGGWLAQGSGVVESRVPANFLALTTATGGVEVTQGPMNVHSRATFVGGVDVNTGALTASSPATFSGGVSVNTGALAASSSASFSGGVNVSSGALNVTSAAAMSGGVTVATGALNVNSSAAMTGGVNVSTGALNVSSAATLSGGVTVTTGELKVNSKTTFDGGSGSAGTVTFNSPSSFQRPISVSGSSASVEVLPSVPSVTVSAPTTLNGSSLTISAPTTFTAGTKVDLSQTTLTIPSTVTTKPSFTPVLYELDTRDPTNKTVAPPNVCVVLTMTQHDKTAAGEPTCNAAPYQAGIWTLKATNARCVFGCF